MVCKAWTMWQTTKNWKEVKNNNLLSMLEVWIKYIYVEKNGLIWSRNKDIYSVWRAPI